MPIQFPKYEYNQFTGHNLLLLMDQNLDSTVLVVGKEIEAWCHGFKNVSFVSNISVSTPLSVRYDLILYHSASVSSRRMFNLDLKQARKILAPDGSFLLFAENTCSFNRLKNLAKGSFSQFARKLWYRHSDYLKALRLAGFKSICSVMPLPCLEQPEELVVAGSKMLELPHYSHPLLHFVHRLGNYHAVAEGFILLGGNKSIEASHLLQRVSGEIARQFQFATANCVLERLDIRLRGAFVLFMTESNSGNGFIVRLVADSETDRIVLKNHEFLEFLQSESEFTGILKSKLPRPICRIEQGGCIVYVETMISGIPAWKINHGDRRRKIFQDAVDFLRQMHFSSRQNNTLTTEILNTLFSDDHDRLTRCTVIAVDFREKLMSLLGSLQNNLVGQSLDLVVSHGDYGYGNILVDPLDGNMLGVIDWDTGKISDFPGIDFLNLLIQKDRAEKKCAVLPAFASLVGRLSDGIDIDDCRITLARLDISETLYNCLVYVTFVRYLTRAAQYPTVFQQEQEDYRAILDLLLERLPL